MGLGNLKKKLEGVVIGKLTAVFLTKIAEGDFGIWAKAAYWWLRGKKGWIGLGLAVVAGGLEYAGKSGACDSVGLTECIDWGAKAAGALAALTLYTSQVDAALHSEAPSK